MSPVLTPRSHPTGTADGHREKSELAKISKTTSASLSEPQCQFNDQKFTQGLISPYFSECLLTEKDVFLLLFEYFKAKLVFFSRVEQIGVFCLCGLKDSICDGPRIWKYVVYSS